MQKSEFTQQSAHTHTSNGLSLSVLPEALLWLSVLTNADAGDLRVLCGRSYLDGVEMAEVVLGEDVPDSFRVLELNSDVVQVWSLTRF